MSWSDEMRDLKTFVTWKASIVAYHFRVWRGTIAVFVLALCFWALWATLANAQTRQCVEWGYRLVRSAEWPHERTWRQRYCMRHGWRGDEYEGRRYYRAPREDYDQRDEQHCRGIRRAVGDQHLTVDGAKKAANEAWAGLIRFHMGEAWIDLINARGISYMCSRSSIKEGGVTTLGQTLTRCEISAQPCRAPRTEETEKQ